MSQESPPPVFGFRCSTCGIWHEGVPMDFGARLPALNVPPEERDRRVWTDGDFCVVDDAEFFIRGCLEIPVRDATVGPFVYGVWTSLSEPSYRRARELIGRDVPAYEPPWFGWFCNGLRGYPRTVG